MTTKDGYQASLDLHTVLGQMAFTLECFGDELAKRKKYKSHRGMEAVHFYLIEKYHWPLSEIRGMKYEDLRFLLEEEMEGWTLPKDAIGLTPRKR